MFVRQADEAYCLGPRRDRPTARRNGYLDHGALERALVATRADAVWLGLGLRRRGPGVRRPVRAARHRLRRARRRRSCAASATRSRPSGSPRSAGVPVAPWSGGPGRHGSRRRSRHATRIGFPLMVKAAAGGGGRGIRRVDAADELAAAFASPRAPRPSRRSATARSCWSAWSTPARHIEVQVIADGQGAAWARRRARLLLPAPPPEGHRGVRQPGADRRAGGRGPRRPRGGSRCAPATATPARSSSSTSPDTQRFSFMEVNARLQVEHPVTEAVTGLDLVKLQLHVAAGGRLEGEPPAARGHAIEARLNAEDPALGFAARPRPGRAAAAADRARRARRHRRGRGRRDPGRVRLDDREGDRLGPRPRRGARAAAARAARTPSS